MIIIKIITMIIIMKVRLRIIMGTLMTSFLMEIKTIIRGKNMKKIRR